MAKHQPTQFLYPLENYTFGKKDATAQRETGLTARLNRHRKKYETEGMRRVVEGLLLVQDHRMPYVLLLQDGSEFRLPGGHLRPGEDEVEGLRRKLTSCLAPTPKAGVPDLLQGFETVGELLAVWWRPNFEPPEYPYLPSHCAKPKECRKIFIIPLPEKAKFAVPKNRKLLAVPLFELYNNSSTFGHCVASMPHLVSRFSFTLVDSSKSNGGESVPAVEGNTRAEGPTVAVKEEDGATATPAETDTEVKSESAAEPADSNEPADGAEPAVKKPKLDVTEHQG